VLSVKSFNMIAEEKTNEMATENTNKKLIFEEQLSRKPDQFPWAQDFIDAMHQGFWTDKEFSFSSDIQDFNVNLNPTEKEIIVRTLSAIGQIEVAVKKFWSKLGDNLPHPSLTDLGYVMANTEVIHNNAYERLLTVLGLEEVFEENLKLDFIEGRVKYLRKYNHKFYKDSKKQYVYALTLFTLFVENVSLFSQFYIINWFNRNQNVLKDTGQQVKYTRNEENIHALAGIKIINTIRSQYPELFDDELEERILSEAQDAFIAESNIVDWMINGFNEKGLNADILKEFIKNRINDSLEKIGFHSAFEVDTSLLKDTMWFEEELIGNNATDFFHSRPVEYSKNSQTFNADELF